MATTNLLTDPTAAFPFDWPEIGSSSSGTDSSLELAPPSNPSRTPGQLFPGFYSTNNFPVASFQQFLPAPQESNSYLFTPLDISAAPYSYPPPPGPPYSRRSLQEELNSDLPLEPSANIQSAYSERVSYAQDDDSPSMIVPPSASVLSPLSPSSASSLPDSTRTRLSPVSVRSSNELPGTGTLRFDPNSQPPSPQTALPEGSPALTVEDSIVTFDSSQNGSKRPKPTQTPEIDPHAAGFLRSQLGDEKWGIFSARLYERRLGRAQNQPRSRAKKAAVDENDVATNGGGASAIDYLVKVEVVKEVLRTYVPHPYNPFKSLSHPYPDSPTGYVTLTRSTILSLSGWSNTQLSYWIRRCEALSMFSEEEPRLKAVAQALHRRLHPSGSSSTAFSDLSTLHTFSSPDSPVSPITSPLSPTSSRAIRSCPSLRPHPDFPDPAITGKGLDQLIDAVKKRTGKSPFLRGRHASLDPFGLPGSGYGADSNHDNMDGRSPAGTEVSFQAKLQFDDGFDGVGESEVSGAGGKRKRRPSAADGGILGIFPAGGTFMGDDIGYDFDGDADAEGETDDGVDGSFDMPFLDGVGGRPPFMMSSARASIDPLSMGNTDSDTPCHASGFYSLSDSRSQLDRRPRKRANMGSF